MPSVENEIAIPVTVGKLESGAAIVLTDDLHMLEVPASLLPSVTVGTMLTMRIGRSAEGQAAREAEFRGLQASILRDFGGTPDGERIEGCLRMEDRTHTTLTIGWPAWEELRGPSRATLHNVDAFLDGRRLPLGTVDTTLKLTGLQAAHQYTVQVVFRSSAGRHPTSTLTLHTAPYEDFSCLRVLGVGELRDELGELGVEVQDSFEPERTAVVVMDREDDEVRQMASEWNVPVVTRDWVSACKAAGRMQSVSQFYYQ